MLRDVKVEFRCVEVKFNDKPGGSNDVGNVTVSGGNVVLPCSAYDEPLWEPTAGGLGLDDLP